MNPSDMDIGRVYSDADITLEPADPLPWSKWPTRFIVRKGDETHSATVNHPHLAFLKVLKEGQLRNVMDVGAGEGVEVGVFKFLGADVYSINADPAPSFKADFIGDYLDARPGRLFDVIWCSHVLEHIRNPGLFLDKFFDELAVGGLLAVSVPYNEFNSGPDTLTYGHHNRYNVLLLLYALICAGFDCTEAAVRVYGGQVSVLVKKKPNAIPPKQTAACWDGPSIAQYLPPEIKEVGLHPAGGNWYPNPIKWAGFYEGGPLIPGD